MYVGPKWAFAWCGVLALAIVAFGGDRVYVVGFIAMAIGYWHGWRDRSIAPPEDED